MTWHDFHIFVWLCTGLWAAGLLMLLIKNLKLRYALVAIFIGAGVIALSVFTAGLWISLERPVFRTLGETRLWYALLISLLGLIIYFRWKLWWMLIYSVIMALVFLFINYTHPDVFDKTLMPALLSPWFIPHVIVYMIAYAILAMSTLLGIIGLIRIYMKRSVDKLMKHADNIVYIGFAFLTLGLLFGALWAKEAWGSYWTWDPKETWAFITWMVYLLYIHFRVNKKENTSASLWILSLAFVVLLICWFGINFLPAAQNSVHVYSS